jgi:hypothetical protein
MMCPAEVGELLVRVGLLVAMRCLLLKGLGHEPAAQLGVMAWPEP